MDELQIAYQETLDYLYSFIDYSLTRNLRNLPEKFDLQRMFDLMKLLGDPQLQFPIIHVAGTKGKGSVSSMISSALRASENKTGLYTSPHLQEFTERIQIDGCPISRNEFIEIVERLKPFVSQIPQLTTFELATAIALVHFADKQVDVAVLEVGLGGRLDATNIVTPVVSVITSISYDHTAVLGNTLSQIAFEKAGIIKPRCPIVVAPQKEEARLVIEKIALERKAPLVEVGKDYLFAPWSRSLEGQSLLVWSRNEQDMVNEFIESGGRKVWEPLRLYIPLLGHHQVENAATAYAALQIARQGGINICEAGIQQGFSEVFWPARFEILRRYPPVVIDSAHNRDSALKLRLTIEDYFPAIPVILLFGASEDKDIEGMFSELLPRVHSVIATQSIHPRAMEAEKLVEIVHRFGKPAKSVTPVEQALLAALEMANNEAIVLVTGSIFITAAVREVWDSMGLTLQKANCQAD